MKLKNTCEGVGVFVTASIVALVIGAGVCLVYWGILYTIEYGLRFFVTCWPYNALVLAGIVTTCVIAEKKRHKRSTTNTA